MLIAADRKGGPLAVLATEVIPRWNREREKVADAGDAGSLDASSVQCPDYLGGCATSLNISGREKVSTEFRRMSDTMISLCFSL